MRDVRSQGILERSLWGDISVFENKPIRTATVLAAVTVGAAVYGIAVATDSLWWAVAIGVTLICIPVAVVKTATACGINALGSFSRYDVPAPARVGSVVLYGLTSTLTSAAIGAIASALGKSWLPPAAIALVPPAFVIAGLNELGVLSFAAPTSRWQVPSRWVKDQRTAPIVWGFFLGSGVATWMPHATFYALLLMAAVAPFPVGVALMGVYGAVRSVPAVLAAASPRFSDRIVLSLSLPLRLLGHAVNGTAAIAIGVVLTLWVFDDRAALAANWMQIDPWMFCVRGIAVGLGVFFAVSAAGKLIAYNAFNATLAQTYRLPTRLARTAGAGVILLEGTCSVLLLVPAAMTLGLVTSAALLVLFLIVATHALVTGANGECGCLGAFGQEALGTDTLVRSGGLALLSAAATFVALRSGSSGATTIPFALSSVSLVFVALALMVTALLIAATVQVIRLPKPYDMQAERRS